MSCASGIDILCNFDGDLPASFAHTLPIGRVVACSSPFCDTKDHTSCFIAYADPLRMRAGQSGEITHPRIAERTKVVLTAYS